MDQCLSGKPESTGAMGTGVDTRDDGQGKANGAGPIPIDGDVNNEKRATLPSDWLGVHCLSPEARKAYCDRHQLRDVPENINEFMHFYSERRARLLDRIAVLVNTV